MTKGLLALVLTACTNGAGETETSDPTSFPTDSDPLVTAGTVCSEDGTGYPAGAVEPMALGKVLFPYRWPDAIHRGTGARGPLDLSLVPCAGDPDIDWSRFAALLFVSIPAW